MRSRLSNVASLYPLRSSWGVSTRRRCFPFASAFSLSASLAALKPFRTWCGGTHCVVSAVDGSSDVLRKYSLFGNRGVEMFQEFVVKGIYCTTENFCEFCGSVDTLQRIYVSSVITPTENSVSSSLLMPYRELLWGFCNISNTLQRNFERSVTRTLQSTRLQCYLDLVGLSKPHMGPELALKLGMSRHASHGQSRF